MVGCDIRLVSTSEGDQNIPWFHQLKNIKCITNPTLMLTSRVPLPGQLVILCPVCLLYFLNLFLPCYGTLLIRLSSNKTSVVSVLQPLDRHTLNSH